MLTKRLHFRIISTKTLPACAAIRINTLSGQPSEMFETAPSLRNKLSQSGSSVFYCGSSMNRDSSGRPVKHPIYARI